MAFDLLSARRPVIPFTLWIMIEEEETAETPTSGSASSDELAAALEAVRASSPELGQAIDAAGVTPDSLADAHDAATDSYDEGSGQG